MTHKTPNLYFLQNISTFKIPHQVGAAPRKYHKRHTLPLSTSHSESVSAAKLGMQTWYRSFSRVSAAVCVRVGLGGMCALKYSLSCHPPPCCVLAWHLLTVCGMEGRDRAPLLWRWLELHLWSLNLTEHETETEVLHSKRSPSHCKAPLLWLCFQMPPRVTGLCSALLCSASAILILKALQEETGPNQNAN